MDFTQAIRDRRERSVQRALAMLAAYDGSDAPTRTSLLQLSAKALGDERVAARWLELLAGESDTGFRARILERLSALDFRGLPRNSSALAGLIECLSQPDAREWALYCLHRLAPRDQSVIAPLIAAYRNQRHDTFARRILANLLMLGQPTPELLAFFQTLLDEIDIDSKTAIVHRLLEQHALSEEQLKKLLAPGEPEVIKVLVLDHLIDRSLRADDVASALLAGAPEPAVRYAAAWMLTETGAPTPEVLNALLKCAASDPDDRVREFVLNAFNHTLAKSPETLVTLANSLPAETSNERASLILKLLTPHLRSEPGVTRALQKIVEQNLSADLAAEIYSALGLLAPWQDELRDWLVDAFVREKHDRVKAAILRPLSKLDDPGAKTLQLCREALALPDPELQQWGARGVLLLPATPENTPAITESASLLLSPEIPLELRIQLAQKIALIAQKSPELLTRLKEIAAQARDFQLQRICEEACNAAANKSLTPDPDGPDWSGWIQRAEVEKRANGIFPAIEEHYDKNPFTAQRILKALLNPACADNLYGCYGYDVTPSSILDLLDRKNAIDDDVSRYCVAMVLAPEMGSPDGWLQFLPANPSFPGLKESTLTIIERRIDANPALLREILVAACGDEDAAGAALAEKMKALPGAALGPFVRLVCKNLAWTPAPELLAQLAARSDLTGAARNEVLLGIKKLGLASAAPSTSVAPPTSEGPGFADD